MNFLLTKAVASLLLPPLNLFLLGATGLVLAIFRRKSGLVLVSLSLAGLFALSMPVVANSLAGWLEGETRAGDSIHGAQAIVILGGGPYANAPEYGGDTVNASTLERIRWGARLHRSTGLPVLVTGGAPFDTPTSEAAQMKSALREDFGVETGWADEKSLTTFESALNARDQLAPQRIDRILLVTHALHMKRARLAFERAGFQVIESPTGFSNLRPRGILGYLPNAYALELSSSFCHEMLGLGWYHLRLAMAGKPKGSQ
ncbi:MAG TPA: YdcF family protein [Burkholderiales bacterium]|nr:YdcF family protein [Burkholderiales bacterium]